MREPSVGRIVFGAAALGMAYGLPRPGTERAVDPGDDAADALVHRALSLGIATFDTAPAYGASEARLGRALGGRGDVWTKVADGDPSASLDRSLVRLARSHIELLQWHNWTASLAEDTVWCRRWSALREDGRVRRLGATTYGRADALAAARSGLFDVVQVEFNVLNQGVVAALTDDPGSREVEVAVRTVYLQGALTDEGRALPPIQELAQAVDRARTVAGEGHLTRLALLAALSNPRIDHAIIGFDHVDQIDAAVASVAQPLGPHLLGLLPDLDLGLTQATDPRFWPR